MTNKNEAVEIVAVEVEAKPKRVRKVTPKVTKTAVEIIHEIEVLTADVENLEVALSEVAPNSVLHPIAANLLSDKKAELKAALALVYTV